MVIIMLNSCSVVSIKLCVREIIASNVFLKSLGLSASIFMFCFSDNFV